MRVGTLHIALAAVGCLVVNWPCMAQTPSELVVEAPHVISTKVQGHSGISIVEKVSYGDLNLATNSGAMELQKRIKASATQICGQLKKLYPDSVETDPPCVERAFQSAMKEANKAIAAAEKKP